MILAVLVSPRGMTIRNATPYLILDGQAERAIALYQEALGAETESFQRFGAFDDSCPEAQKHLVMHAALRIGETQLMLSDGPGHVEMPAGSRVQVALDFDDLDQMQASFDALAKDGSVIQAPFAAPWGAMFGALTDVFGVSWMITCPLAETATGAPAQ